MVCKWQRIGNKIGNRDYYKLPISPKLYCLCSRDIRNFIVCAVATFKTLLFVQSRHSKLYCLCSRDIQNFIVCAVEPFETLLFVQSRHSKLYCLCSRDIQNFIVCAVATFKTLLFVQSRHSKLYCLCSRDIQNFIVCAVETFFKSYVICILLKLASLLSPLALLKLVGFGLRCL